MAGARGLAMGSGKRWTAMAAIAVIAVSAGIALPQALPSPPDLPKVAPAGETKSNSELKYQSPALPETPDSKAMLTRLGLATAGVLALLVGTLYAGRRWLSAAPAGVGLGNQLKLAETLVLGNRCTLHLVSLGRRQILVAADGTGVKSVVPLNESFENALSEISESDAAVIGAERNY